MMPRSDRFPFSFAADAADAAGFRYRDTRARARSRFYETRAASAASAAASDVARLGKHPPASLIGAAVGRLADLETELCR
jgi:hypothetical protein